LEPEIGFYDDYIVLVDFNSLYPSIIRNFNICFTTIQRNLLEYDGGINLKKTREERVDDTKVEEREKEDEKVDIEAQKNEEVDYLGRIRNTHIEMVNGEYKEVQNTETPILVRIVTLLIEKRKQVKNLLKNKNLEAIQRRKFDIMQMAYKLTANSIYGCLGFPSSRFYSRLIADTVTGLGRQLLVQSKQKIEESGYKVIYGDTDSIMINTENKSIQEAVREALKIKEIINKMFRKKKTAGQEIEFENQEMSKKYNEKYNQDKIVEEQSDEQSQKDQPKKPKKQIGSQEGILQVGIDGVYKKLLLIRKKKYAGLMVTNWNEMASRREKVEKTKLEMKGLEVVRRDCSQITREITQRAIEIILYHENYHELMEAHLLSYKNAIDSFAKAFNKPQNEIEALGENEKLKRPLAIQYKVNSALKVAFKERSLNDKQNSSQTNAIKPEEPEEKEQEAPRLPYENIRISLNSFVIKKMLNKALKYYTDMESHPHLVVAKYLIEKENKTDEELIGRFISYIITETKGKNSSVGKKARHISAIKKENANVDLKWYLMNQIKPILCRSIGVVPIIDESFICKMLGIKQESSDAENKKDSHTDYMMYKKENLPLYFKKILNKFGLKNNDMCSMFLSVCPNEQCPGCYVFHQTCPDQKNSNISFSKNELQLRLEIVLHQISKKYRESMQMSIEGPTFEINPLLDKKMSKEFRSKYNSIDEYFLRLHVCFYLYFLFFKAAVICSSFNLNKKPLNDNLTLMNILNYENRVKNVGFEKLLNGVNQKLKGFKTNYLNDLIDLNNIKV
jgi:DNA polymerase alpha subunit A